MSKKPNFYELLGVSQNATPAEIKKAYQKLVIANHPDRAVALGKSVDELTEKTKQLNKARDILLSAEQRDIYDRSLKSGQSFDDFKNTNQYGGYEEDLSELLKRFHRQTTQSTGSNEDFSSNGYYQTYFSNNESGNSNSKLSEIDINIEIELTLEDVYNGAQKTITYPCVSSCEKCINNSQKCNICKGTGFITYLLFRKECSNCGGRKYVNSFNCIECKNNRVIKANKSITLNITKGNMGPLCYKKQGNYINKKNGDLYLHIKIKKHSNYEIDEKGNIHTNIKVDIYEALVGTKISFKYLDGKDTSITLPACLEKDQHSVYGMGLQGKYSTGSLIFHISIHKPNLSQSEKIKLRESIPIVSDSVFKRN